MARLRPRLPVAALVAGALTAAAVTIGAGAIGGGGSPNSTFSLAQARSFTGFPVYFAGEAVGAVPLVAVLRRTDAANYVSFIYGTCAAESDLGCAPPGEIQVWPACTRNPSLYRGIQSVISPAPSLATVRGVPAAWFEDGHRLELQTGASTVVVFGSTREFVLRLAAELRGVNTAVGAGEPLPPPPAGALDGTLAC